MKIIITEIIIKLGTEHHTETDTNNMITTIKGLIKEAFDVVSKIKLDIMTINIY